MLGELYKPKGLALDTASAVLEVKDPYGCNVAWGCSNGCLYCYGPKVGRQSREAWMKVRLPKKSPKELVESQIKRVYDQRRKANAEGVPTDVQHYIFDKSLPTGVFISFDTDPFLPETRDATDNLIALLRGDYGVRVATLSKMDCSWRHGVRQGMTIVSLEDNFWRQYEPNTIHPEGRLITLKTCKYEFDDFVWVSMEPYPPSAIYKQDFESFLKALKFVDLIVFGKWNYDVRARTEKARQEYAEDIGILVDFSRKNDVRLHVKSDTMAFAYPDREDPTGTRKSR